MSTADGGPQTAAGALERALERNPDNLQAHLLLGSLYAWQGEQSAALGHLQAAVTLDGRTPLARHAPWALWQRKVRREPAGNPWDDLLWVYGHWTTRYPQRAEVYVLPAIVWARQKEDAARAIELLERGIELGAEPAALLRYAREELSP
jgi:tetratricopeptide (TPR) repeat protein